MGGFYYGASFLWVKDNRFVGSSLIYWIFQHGSWNFHINVLFLESNCSNIVLVDELLTVLYVW